MKRPLLLASVTALALACTGCATALGIGVGTALDHHNMETRVPVAELGSLAPGDHVRLVLTDGQRLDADVLALDGADGPAPALRVQLTPPSPRNLTQTPESTAFAPRTIAASELRSVVRRRPGFGWWWVYAAAGFAFDAWLIHALAGID